MSQNEEQSPAVKNRRFIPRRKPRGPARVTCTTAPGRANLAQTLLDVSRSGARLLIRSELARGVEVAVGLPWPGRARHDTLQATVAWCLAVARGGFCVGVQFHRLLSEETLRSVLSSAEAAPPSSQASLPTPTANQPVLPAP